MYELYKRRSLTTESKCKLKYTFLGVKKGILLDSIILYILFRSISSFIFYFKRKKINENQNLKFTNKEMDFIDLLDYFSFVNKK